jgi:hypothetical protein
MGKTPISQVSKGKNRIFDYAVSIIFMDQPARGFP